MSQSHLLVATDFSQAAHNALQHAAAIAKQSGDAITLMHVKASNTKRLLEKVGRAYEHLELYLAELCQQVKDTHGVSCVPLIKEGNILTSIMHTASETAYRILIMGTHGSQGLRQQVFGADILKIVKRMPVPVLVIPPENHAYGSYQRIVFPFGGHESFGNKINATAFLAKLFHAEVHIYAIERPMEEISKVTMQNVESAKTVFQDQGIQFKEVREPSEVYAPGFAQQTVAYAHKVQAPLIAVMAVPSVEYAYISTIDKDYLINNEFGIAILMTSDY